MQRDLPPARTAGPLTPADPGGFKRHAQYVNEYNRRYAIDSIVAGLLLAEVRDKLPKEVHFRQWIRDELNISKSAVYRLIELGEVFRKLLVSHGETREVRMIEPDALSRLCEARYPRAGREYAVYLAEQNQWVDVRTTDEILDAHRPKPDPDRAAVRQYRQATRALKLDEDRPGPAKQDPRVELIEKLWDESTVLHLGKIEDAEDDPLFSVTRFREDDRPRNVMRRNRWDALFAAYNAEPEKVCQGVCKSSRPISMFGVDAGEPDGRNAECKACARARQAARKRAAREKKRAEKAAGGPDSSPTVPAPEPR